LPSSVEEVAAGLHVPAFTPPSSMLPSSVEEVAAELHMAAIDVFGVVHGRRAARRQPPALTSSSASAGVVEVEAPPRRPRQLGRRPQQ
jgi:hypothetical protein